MPLGKDFGYYHPKTVVIGRIRTVRKAFLVLGVANLPEVSIPPSLAEYPGCQIWKSTLGDIRKMDKGKARFFLKPLENYKLFTGHTHTGAMQDLIATAILFQSIED